jgi:RHS repeat-associated protein
LESRLTNLTIKAGAETVWASAYTYDAMGMMRSVASVNQIVDYGYDAVYQLTSEVVNTSGTVTTNGWSYDSAGNMRGVTRGAQQTLLEVNSDNELVSLGELSGVGTGLVNSLTVDGQVDPGPASNKWYNSTAMARGQSTHVNPQDGGFAITNVPVSPGANALTATVQDVSANVATQVVNFTVQTVTNRASFSYDANGNLSSVQSVSSVDYSYDAENRLVRAISNSVPVLQCWYDGAGRRVAKREIIGTQTNTVQYVWNGWTLIAVLGEDGQLKEYYTRGRGIARDIGALVAVTHYTGGSPSATYYLHNNHRGDVILARQGTNTVATLDYAPYGELRSQTGTYAPRFRFSSKEYDASTGFYHFPYRYYAPMWARWITRDPIGEAELLECPNLYTYVHNSPLSYLDPDGRETIKGEIEDKIKDKIKDKVKEWLLGKVPSLKEAKESCKKIEKCKFNDDSANWTAECFSCAAYKCALTAVFVIQADNCLKAKMLLCSSGIKP